MKLPGQSIVRNQSRLAPGPVLLVNPQPDSLFRELQSNERTVRVFTQHHGDHRWFSGCGAASEFGVTPAPDGSIRTVILTLPREKDRLVMMLHALSSTMPKEACLWLVGENKAGIKSAPRYLEQFFSNVVKLDSARHCVLFEASDALEQVSFNLDDYATLWPVEFSEKTINVVSLPGVFAHGRLDKGTRLLLDTLVALRPGGKILDFACGSGVIACSLMAVGAGADLTLLDVSSLAIESSHRSLLENGFTAHLLPSDGLAELEGRYDWIISNPPFHRGVSNDLEISAGFFSAAGTFLTDNGRIVIVCNRHLPYRSWLQNHFHQVKQLGANDEYLIIQASKPLSS